MTHGIEWLSFMESSALLIYPRIYQYIIAICRINVIGAEKSWLPCTQKQDALSPSYNCCTHPNNAGIGGDSYPGCFCCCLFLRLVRHPQVLG